MTSTTYCSLLSRGDIVVDITIPNDLWPMMADHTQLGAGNPEYGG
jgi:hypothetical protein